MGQDKVKGRFLTHTLAISTKYLVWLCSWLLILCSPNIYRLSLNSSIYDIFAQIPLFPLKELDFSYLAFAFSEWNCSYSIYLLRPKEGLMQATDAQHPMKKPAQPERQLISMHTPPLHGSSLPPPTLLQKSWVVCGKSMSWAGARREMSSSSCYQQRAMVPCRTAAACGPHELFIFTCAGQTCFCSFSQAKGWASQCAAALLAGVQTWCQGAKQAPRAAHCSSYPWSRGQLWYTSCCTKVLYLLKNIYIFSSLPDSQLSPWQLI